MPTEDVYEAPCRICAVPASRSRSSHARPKTSLTRQPWQNSKVTAAPSRNSWDAVISDLASAGERARPAFTRFARGDLTRSNWLAGIRPELDRFGEGLAAELPTVEHGVRRVLVEQLRLPLRESFSADIDDTMSADVVGQVAGELLVAVERRGLDVMAGDRFEPPVGQLRDGRVTREAAGIAATSASLTSRRASVCTRVGPETVRRLPSTSR